MQQRLGITFIYVTHDQEEALTMSDTIVVLKDGVIQQIGTPADIYNEPKNPFVADFIGREQHRAGHHAAGLPRADRGAAYECVDAGFGRNVEVDVVVRPEDIGHRPARPGAAARGGAVGRVMGVHYEVDVDCGGYEWVVHTTDYVAVGDEVGLSLPPDAFHVMKKTRSMNIFAAVAHPEDGLVTFGGHDFACALGRGLCQKRAVLVQIQPADVELIAPQDAELTGFVKACMFLGTHYEGDGDLRRGGLDRPRGRHHGARRGDGHPRAARGHRRVARRVSAAEGGEPLKRTMFAGPYLVWMLIFILSPMLLILLLCVHQQRELHVRQPRGGAGRGQPARAARFGAPGAVHDGAVPAHRLSGGVPALAHEAGDGHAAVGVLHRADVDELPAAHVCVEGAARRVL